MVTGNETLSALYRSFEEVERYNEEVGRYNCQ